MNTTKTNQANQAVTNPQSDDSAVTFESMHPELQETWLAAMRRSGHAELAESFEKRRDVCQPGMGEAVNDTQVSQADIATTASQSNCEHTEVVESLENASEAVREMYKDALIRFGYDLKRFGL